MRRRIVSQVVLATLALTMLVIGAPEVALASPADLIDHSGTGRAIDIFNGGESYAGTTGGGSYALSAYDDPNASQSTFPGDGCYRSWNTAAYQAYNLLKSKGLFINRACHGKLLEHTMPEVNNLSEAIKDRIDLINFSNGGNDVGFKEIAMCISMPWAGNQREVVPTYGEVSADCVRLMETLTKETNVNGADGYSNIVRGQRDQIVSLLSAFKNAKLILQGYPLLIDETPSKSMEGKWYAFGTAFDVSLGKRTWKYVSNELNRVLLSVERQQLRLVASDASRLGYNNLYRVFGGWENNHGVGAGKNWLNEPVTLPIPVESYHPNATGLKEIALGLVGEVSKKGWFSTYPSQTKPNDQYYYYPEANGGVTHYLTSREGSMVKTTRASGISHTSFLDSCRGGQAENMDGRSPRPGHPDLQIFNGSQDRITITCMKAQKGAILTIAKSGTLEVTDPSYYANSVNSRGEVEWQHITTAWMFNCLNAGGPGIRFYGTQSVEIGNPAGMPGRAECVPREWLKKVLRAPDGSSWYVDEWGWRHWIPDPETFFALEAKYGPAITIPAQVDVDTIPRGDDHPKLLHAPYYENKIICRTDGVCWVVSNDHEVHIADRPTEICAKYVHKLPVARTDLTYELARTIPEVSWKYSCNLENSILRAMDKADPKPSFAFYGGKIYWISDGWTWDFLVQKGFRVVDVATETEIRYLPYGGTEIRLDEAGIPNNSIICRNDGVCWVLYDGILHHIPFAQDDVCWRWLRGLKVAASGLSDVHIKSVYPEGNTWPCIIGNRIVKSDDGTTSYWVGTDNVKHEIPDAETFWVLAKSYEVVGPWPASELDKLPTGSRMPYQIDPSSVVNTIICRNDGICWVVDGNGVRHLIPDYTSNICWRWVRGWGVSRSGLNFEQANSLGEAEAWGCNLDAYILVTNEGAAFRMWGTDRRWIQDPESYYCYAMPGNAYGYGNAAGIIRGISMNEVAPIHEGSWMPRCLNRDRVKGKVIRNRDGTAYWVDWSGYWHWIPNGDVWYCLTRKYPVLIWDATWEQINSIKREGAHANCNM